ncbi:hypothetical protein BRADI_3g19798v3 [Brachypodium distachyon]|uniref:Uncharacterized protein n=1 Tax=Brachypodium distachyon TaxID=15368 RepID=A0A0Q3JC69_BRADI|nr:hypothetical protein BRADI_3g19798v3 [Brachypodium distachyon]
MGQDRRFWSCGVCPCRHLKDGAFSSHQGVGLMMRQGRVPSHTLMPLGRLPKCAGQQNY